MTRAVAVLMGACFGLGAVGFVIARLSDRPLEVRRNRFVWLRTRREDALSCGG